MSARRRQEIPPPFGRIVCGIDGSHSSPEGVALVAVGSRGLSGARALGSVSERVAHRAPCSVLVARPT